MPGSFAAYFNADLIINLVIIGIIIFKILPEVKTYFRETI